MSNSDIAAENNFKKYIDTCFIPSDRPCLAAHVYALRHNASGYLDTLRGLRNGNFGKMTSSAVRARILAALHITSKHEVLQEFLDYCDPMDIAKALTMLDRPRQSRQLQRKIQKIENDNPHLIEIEMEKEEAEEKEENEAGKSNETEKDSEATSTGKKKKRSRKIDVYRRKFRAIERDFKQEITNQNIEDEDECEWTKADTAVRELIESSSVSGALARKIRAWSKAKLTSDYLEFVMLEMPKEAWKTIADLVHFSPGDFCVPYFLADIHGEAIPGHCFVSRMRELAEAASDSDADLTQKFLALAEGCPQTYQAYSYLRTLPFLLQRAEIAEHLARRIPLDTVVWHFEELHQASSDCEGILVERLETEDILHTPSSKCKVTFYGKLLERILTFRRMGLTLCADSLVPIAGKRLEELRRLYNSEETGGAHKVAVFGDASMSMQCAIEAATIFASMVSACFSGELSFFNRKLVASPHKKPQTAQETLSVCAKVRAKGSTSFAAGLWPYYQKRVSIDLFVLVTDEEENVECRGHMFAPLLKKYKEVVNEKVQLLVVCVGGGNTEFRQSLRDNDIDHKVVTIDAYRPDLTKFDALLGQIAAVAMDSATPSLASKEGGALSETPKEDQGGFVIV